MLVYSVTLFPGMIVKFLLIDMDNLVVTFTFACLCIELWSTGMEIWALCIALLIGKYLRLMSKLADC